MTYPPQPPQLSRSWLSFAGTLPAHFDGPVGAYPQNVFRPEYVRLPPLSGVFVAVDHSFVECDGKLYRLEVDGRRAEAMTLGRFFALHLRNQRSVPAELLLRVYGSTVDAPGPLGTQMQLGIWLTASAHDPEAPSLAMSAGREPAPEPPEASS